MPKRNESIWSDFANPATNLLCDAPRAKITPVVVWQRRVLPETARPEDRATDAFSEENREKRKSVRTGIARFLLLRCAGGRFRHCVERLSRYFQTFNRDELSYGTLCESKLEPVLRPGGGTDGSGCQWGG